MNRWLGRVGWGLGATIAAFGSPAPVLAQTVDQLRLVYPPDRHQTTSDRVFFLGTAPADGPVTINGQPVNRSRFGHFAPSLPLQWGENRFELRWGDRTLTRTVIRRSAGPVLGTQALTALQPAVDLARPVGEPVCVSAVGLPDRVVTAVLSDRRVPLLPQATATDPPPNAAVLTGNLDQPLDDRPVLTTYEGCTTFDRPGELGRPTFTVQGAPATANPPMAAGSVTIWPTDRRDRATVTAPIGVARTGPSTDHSRLTPLPQGTSATITGREGDWWRLSYGGWIAAREVTVQPGSTPLRAIVRGIRAANAGPALAVQIPLSQPVPVEVRQEGRDLVLTLHQAIAQTDTIFLQRNPAIERLDWQVLPGDRLEYRARLATEQAWGWSLRYEGNTLVWRIKHPPVRSGPQPLSGVTVLLDPGHGGAEPGALNAAGIPEKTPNLQTSLKLQAALERRGARVVLTRSTDRDLPIPDRVAQIAELEPTIALSVHYNALPDDGNAETTQGVGMFWYHPQAQPLAQFLHDELTRRLGRPSYGVFWGNLALARPSIAPAVLLELGFMSHPTEAEWITDAAEQDKLAEAIAASLEAWFDRVAPPP